MILRNFWFFALFVALVLLPVPLIHAQPATSNADGSGGTTSTAKSYTPPTQAERFRTYIRHTYSLASFLEAGARAGIDQGLDRPSQWQEGAVGYAERFGSAAGSIVARGTTQYALAAVFKEDLRRERCGAGCSDSKFKLALEDTFTARRGEDGHRTASIARLLGPISGSLIASTWRPDGLQRGTVGREIGLSFGFVFVRNLVRREFDSK